MSRSLITHQQRGFILVVVLLLVVLLSAVLIEFNYRARINFHFATNDYRGRQALACAKAGIELAIAALRKYPDIYVDEDLTQLLSGGIQFPVGEGHCSVSVQEESGKININALKDRRGRIIRRRVDQLLRLFDLMNVQYGDEAPLSYGLAPAMIDWADDDDSLTVLSFVQGENEGAENNYYEKQENPYPCKNAPFDSVKELLLVRGMTPEILDGRPADPERAIPAVEGLRSFLTVYGDGKININYASPRVLESLSEEMEPALVQAIIEERNVQPFGSIQDLLSLPGMTQKLFAQIRPLITAQEADRYYRVLATGTVPGYRRQVEVILRRPKNKSRIAVLQRREPSAGKGT